MGTALLVAVFIFLVARWDPENLWVDIRLRSTANQVVNVAALDMLVPFGAGEEMRTEISTKFLRPGLEGIYAEAGLELTDWWTYSEGLYALSLLHDRDSNRKFGLSVDGIGFPGNPRLGFSKPRAAAASAWAGTAPVRLRIVLNYRHGLFSFGPLERR